MICEKACEHAIAVGLPQYSGMQSKPKGCGNCDHYLEPAELPGMWEEADISGGASDTEFAPKWTKWGTVKASGIFLSSFDHADVKFYTIPKAWPVTEAKWEPEVENYPAPLDDPTVQAARIDHLMNGGGFGHAGTHHGTGAPGCPKAVHHHHDMFCPAPTQDEWERAGNDGPVPGVFHWMYSRM